MDKISEDRCMAMKNVAKQQSIEVQTELGIMQKVNKVQKYCECAQNVCI